MTLDDEPFRLGELPPEKPKVTPPVGTKLKCFWNGSPYRGEVVRHGKKRPIVRFNLKNGRLIQGPATVVPTGPLPTQYVGYLAQLDD